MPHAHHFLERLDRVTRAHMEFALELYRDHEAVKYILDHVNLPEGAARVAFAIDDPREGPFVIVTRDGRFVTCLGAGMHHEHHVVPRAQTDALLAKVADKRARREIAKRELRPDEDEDDLFQRILSRGKRLAREDFVALSAFEAMLGISPFSVMIDLAADVVLMREAMAPGVDKVVIKGTTTKSLERQDRMEWAVAHLMLLSCAAERKDLTPLLNAAKGITTTSPTYLCSAQAGSSFFLRSAWAAARLGKDVIPTYKSALSTAKDWIGMFEAALGLGAIGLRHSGAAADVKRFLAAQHPLAEADPKDMEQVGRAVFGHYVMHSMDASEERMGRILATGRDLCVTYSDGLPDGHALKFTKPEDVPDDLARTAVLSTDLDVHNENVQNFIFHVMPLAARASAEEFYFPREVVRAWLGQWTPEETLERLKRAKKALPKKAPVRIENKVGRNDPCTCGSGKKWKKCHGLGDPPAS